MSIGPLISLVLVAAIFSFFHSLGNSIYKALVNKTIKAKSKKRKRIFKFF